MMRVISVEEDTDPASAQRVKKQCPFFHCHYKSFFIMQFKAINFFLKGFQKHKFITSLSSRTGVPGH
jgi:hypothetical protein